MPLDLAEAIDKRQIYTGEERYLRREIGVFVATCDLEAVDAVLVHAVPWTDDGPVPVMHHDIVAVLQTVRDRSIADSLFSLLELFEETKVARNFGHDVWILKAPLDF